LGALGRDALAEGRPVFVVLVPAEIHLALLDELAKGSAAAGHSAHSPKRIPRSLRFER
jgi:hypothetical protein